MNKLPEIYKEVININNNKNVFYSKNENIIIQTKEEKREITNKNTSIPNTLKTIFSLGKNSYTKKVRLKTNDKIYETRLIRRNNGRILTIDNDIIEERNITSLEII